MAREAGFACLWAADPGDLEIAARRILSSRTVENPVTAIFARPAVSTRADAVIAARRVGIVSQSE